MRYIKSLLCSVTVVCMVSNGYARENAVPNASPKETQPQERSLTTQFFQPDARLNAMVDSVYNAMTPKQRAAQMIMTASSPSEKLGYPFEKAKKMLAENIAANVVFLKGTAAGFRQEAKEMNRAEDSKKTLKPLFACDCEPTLMPGKWTDISDIQPASEQKDADAVITNTEKINAAMKKTGVQLNFAPVVDIAANKSVINKRSFGSDPQTITDLSRQFVETSQGAGIGATLKHFPGHGAVKGDSHKQSVFIDGPLTELTTFKNIIQSSEQPVAVMVGHIVVKNNAKYDTRGLPSTLSRTIVTDLLRNELKFNGIITTDALNMEAAAKVPDADWMSVQAGVDLVLMPKDAATLNNKIVAAMAAHDGLSKQIETSVKRMIRYKLLTQ